MNKHLTTTNEILAGLGPVIRAAMADAIEAIRGEAATFVAEAKRHYDGVKEDVVTTADRAAQRLYVDRFAEAFPTVGLIGEEDGLKRSCAIPGEDIYLTIDPLDGTKAFARHQSHGVGTMVGAVRNGKVVAGYVGDVNTGEIYGFAPDAPIPTRTRFGVERPMAPDTAAPLGTKRIMIDAAPCRFPERIQRMILRPEEGGLFKEMEVMGGSYGVYCARLWKGEVGALILDPSFATPWDETPVMGIAEALGFATIKIDPETCAVEAIERTPSKEVFDIPFISLVVHRDYVSEVLAWFAREDGPLE